MGKGSRSDRAGDRAAWLAQQTATAALSIETQQRRSAACPQSAPLAAGRGSGRGGRFHPPPHSWDGKIFIRRTLAGCSLR